MCMLASSPFVFGRRMNGMTLCEFRGVCITRFHGEMYAE